jgi:MFS family permease
MLVDAISYLVSVLAISRIKMDESTIAKKDRGRLRDEIIEGLKFVTKHPIIGRITASTATFNFFTTAVHTLVPVLVLRNMDVSPALFGLVFTAAAGAGLAGALSVSKIGEWLGQGNTVILALVVSGLATFGFAFAALIGEASALPLVIASYSVMSFGGLVYNITQVSARQALCPEHLLGRMNASIRFFVLGIMPISALLSGAFATWFGLAPVFFVGSVGAVLACWFVFASPLRGLKTIVPKAE